MNEQFRVAHKLGLMFQADTLLFLEDVKVLGNLVNLHAKSPALGIKKVKAYPKAIKFRNGQNRLQPDLLKKRDDMFRTLYNTKCKKGQRMESRRPHLRSCKTSESIRDNLMGEKDRGEICP